MAINAEIEFEDASNFYQARELSERLALLAGIDEAGSDITSRRDTLLKNLILEEKTRAFAAEIEEGLIEDLAHLDPDTFQFGLRRPSLRKVWNGSTGIS